MAVNRIWQSIFGVGLVETAEDFGTRAPVPEYRELLDWLAVDFMEHGWSQKHLIRTIVNSATYQQSSKASPALLESDPRNHWLARGPSFRADAEVVRDIALSVSGLITHKLGGPSVIPPVPQNVLDYNFVYPAYWKPAEGPERYRRTLYGFRKRSMPDPVMSTFDAPNGDFACARRMRSNTPLAALATLNEPIFVEAARALALRILREGGRDDVQRADYAFFLCTSRRPTTEERDAILDLVQSRRRRLADGWLNVREVATGDPARLPEMPAETTPQDAAAWTLAARVLLNLDETISKKNECDHEPDTRTATGPGAIPQPPLVLARLRHRAGRNRRGFVDGLRSRREDARGPESADAPKAAFRGEGEAGDLHLPGRRSQSPGTVRQQARTDPARRPAAPCRAAQGLSGGVHQSQLRAAWARSSSSRDTGNAAWN